MSSVITVHFRYVLFACVSSVSFFRFNLFVWSSIKYSGVSSIIIACVSYVEFACVPGFKLRVCPAFQLLKKKFKELSRSKKKLSFSFVEQTKSCSFV